LKYKKCEIKKIPSENYLSHAKDAISRDLTPVFEASTDAIGRRIEYDNLDKLIP
jgi:hypothetical protein